MIRVSRILAVMVALALTATVVLAQSLRAGRTKGGIAYELQGRGPVVVLITGSNLDRRMWTREAEWLGHSYTVIRYDLRAHGASDTATTPFSHVDDIPNQSVATVGGCAGCPENQGQVSINAELETDKRRSVCESRILYRHRFQKRSFGQRRT